MQQNDGTPRAVKRAFVEDMEVLMPLIRERLSAGQSVRFFPRGVSMLPLLRQEVDSVVISPLKCTLKKYDIPLYQRENGKYVLHRVIRVGETYSCMGDNQFTLEAGLKQEQMIAVVTAFYRDSRKYQVNHFGYWIYCRFWHHSRPLRRLWRRGVRWIRRKLR